MEEIISTGKILRSHCQPKVGVTDGKYQSSWPEVLGCWAWKKGEQNGIHNYYGS
jgi:hypothetical protein